jgi:hypothetical protein
MLPLPGLVLCVLWLLRGGGSPKSLSWVLAVTFTLLFAQSLVSSDRRVRRLTRVLLGSVMLTFWLLVALTGRTNEVRHVPGETLTFVEEVLPAPREEVLAAVGRAFEYTYERARSTWMQGCYVRPFEAGVERSLVVGPDPALLRFIALPAERKRDDSWLECDGEWASEYQSPRGEPLPFTTNFIIHVEPVSALATRVEIVEYFPYVVAGRRFGFQRHSPVPWWIPDTQRVGPTTRDRVEVLRHIRETVRRM